MDTLVTGSQFVNPIPQQVGLGTPQLMPKFPE